MASLPERFVAWGAHKAAQIPVANISFAREFRTLCESNACGKFGRSHMCPPDVGEIDDLIAEARAFEQAVVYQTVGTLEDSFDIEGMLEAGARHNELAQRISENLREEPFRARLHLGAGGCRVCERCSKMDGLPCLYPDKAMSSLEAYGIDVSVLAARCGLKYIHGPNTVTFFGAFFFTP